MEKLNCLLLDLTPANDSITIETNEILKLLNKLTNSVETHQESGVEIQNKLNEIQKLEEKQEHFFAELKETESAILQEIQELKYVQSDYHIREADENKLDGCLKDVLNNLEHKLELFGIQIEAQFVKPSIFQAKIWLAKDKFFIFNYDIIHKTYDLQTIEPNHKNFDEIWRFLMETGDIAGFVYHLRKKNIAKRLMTYE